MALVFYIKKYELLDRLKFPTLVYSRENAYGLCDLHVFALGDRTWVIYWQDEYSMLYHRIKQKTVFRERIITCWTAFDLEGESNRVTWIPDPFAWFQEEGRYYDTNEMFID